MKTSAGLSLCVLLLAGCQSMPTTSGRNLQFTSGTADHPRFQINLHTSEWCAERLAFERQEWEANVPNGKVKCSDESISAKLPWRATWNRKADPNFKLDLEAIDASDCNTYLRVILENPNVESPVGCIEK